MEVQEVMKVKFEGLYEGMQKKLKRLRKMELDVLPRVGDTIMVGPEGFKVHGIRWFLTARHKYVIIDLENL